MSLWATLGDSGGQRCPRGLLWAPEVSQWATLGDRVTNQPSIGNDLPYKNIPSRGQRCLATLGARGVRVGYSVCGVPMGDSWRLWGLEVSPWATLWDRMTNQPSIGNDLPFKNIPSRSQRCPRGRLLATLEARGVPWATLGARGVPVGSFGGQND